MISYSHTIAPEKTRRKSSNAGNPLPVILFNNVVGALYRRKTAALTHPGAVHRFASPTVTPSTPTVTPKTGLTLTASDTEHTHSVKTPRENPHHTASRAPAAAPPTLAAYIQKLTYDLGNRTATRAGTASTPPPPQRIPHDLSSESIRVQMDGHRNVAIP